MGLGPMAQPILQDLVALGMPNSSSNHFSFFFFLRRGLRGDPATGVKKRDTILEEEEEEVPPE